jgi:hypothetical protein
MEHCQNPENVFSSKEEANNAATNFDIEIEAIIAKYKVDYRGYDCGCVWYRDENNELRLVNTSY